MVTHIVQTFYGMLFKYYNNKNFSEENQQSNDLLYSLKFFSTL